MLRGLIVVLALVGLAGAATYFMHSERIAMAPSDAQAGLFTLQSKLVELGVESERNPVKFSTTYVTALQSMIAAGVVIAAFLSLVLAWRPLQQTAAHLRLSLALGSASVGYILAIHPWAWLEGWGGPGLIALACLALAASMVSLWLFVRFAAGYPQSVRSDELPERSKIDWFGSKRIAHLAREHGGSYFRAVIEDIKRGFNPRAFSDFLQSGKRQDSSRNKLLDRQLHRFLQGPRSVIGLCVLIVASMVLTTLETSTFVGLGQIGLGVLWLLVPAFVYLPACMHYWEIGYARGDESQRRTIRWMLASIYLAVVIYFAGSFMFLAMFAFGFVLGAGDFFAFLLVNLFIWLLPGAWFLLLLAIAASIFLRGAVEPTLILKRSMLYGIIAVFMTMVFVTLESLLQSEALARFDLSDQFTVVLTGTAVALVVGPLRSRIEKAITRVVDGLLPPADGQTRTT